MRLRTRRSQEELPGCCRSPPVHHGRAPHKTWKVGLEPGPDWIVIRYPVQDHRPIDNSVQAGNQDGDEGRPGAATYYNGNQQSFFDKYDDKLYYGSLLLGSLISIVVAAWRFAASGAASQSMLEPLFELGNEIKGAKSEAELEEIEKRIDDILKAELARNANGEGADSSEMAALSLAAHRLQYLMSHRRISLRKTD
jgi:hypothetical protein